MHSNLTNSENQTTITTSDCSERGSCMSSISSNGSSSILGEENEDNCLSTNNKKATKNCTNQKYNGNKRAKKDNNSQDDDSSDSSNDNKIALTRLSNDLNNASNLQSSFNISSSDSVYEINARILLMTIKWCKSLQSFNSLVYRDQVIKLTFLKPL